MSALVVDDHEMSPAARLAGAETLSGWKIGERIKRLDGQTGASFSVGYLATNQRGQIAFLKALDFSDALQQENSIQALETAIRAYSYEEEMVMLCSDKRMTRIVRALESGYIQVDASTLGRVPYLLFEPAQGDVRKAIMSFDAVTLNWAVTLLHEVAVGLQQLHFANIAHQDLKPSNVLTFEGKEKFKLSDLGCSSLRGRDCPRDGKKVPGGWSVSPPELQYSEISGEWVVRRVAADLYSLGSLAVFLFAGASMNAVVRDFIPEGKDYMSWRGGFREVFPFVRQAYDEGFEFISDAFEGSAVGADVFQLVKELCEPDPLLRGNRGFADPSQQYSIQKYVSKLGKLRARTAYAEKVALRQ